MRIAVHIASVLTVFHHFLQKFDLDIRNICKIQTDFVSDEHLRQL